MTGTANDERSGMSSTGALRPANRTQMPAAVRAYLAHERVIRGTRMVLLLSCAGQGPERGWWADAVRPLLGDAAQRLRLKPIFVSSPTLIAAACSRMFF